MAHASKTGVARVNGWVWTVDRKKKMGAFSTTSNFMIPKSASCGPQNHEGHYQCVNLDSNTSESLNQVPSTGA